MDDTPGGDRRMFVKADRYAVFKLRRAYLLSTSEAFLLDSLVKLVAWRDDSFAWSGTYERLADETGVSRNTVPKALRRLCDLHLAVEVAPFTGGYEVAGTVALPAYYGVLVQPEEKRKSEFPTTYPLMVAELVARIEEAYAKFCAQRGLDPSMAPRDLVHTLRTRSAQKRAQAGPLPGPTRSAPVDSRQEPSAAQGSAVEDGAGGSDAARSVAGDTADGRAEASADTARGEGSDARPDEPVKAAGQEDGDGSVAPVVTPVSGRSSTSSEDRHADTEGDGLGPDGPEPFTAAHERSATTEAPGGGDQLALALADAVVGVFTKSRAVKWRDDVRAAFADALRGGPLSRDELADIGAKHVPDDVAVARAVAEREGARTRAHRSRGEPAQPGQLSDDLAQKIRSGATKLAKEVVRGEVTAGRVVQDGSSYRLPAVPTHDQEHAHA